MDKHYLMNTRIPLQIEPSMPIPWSSDQSFSMDHQFDSSLTSDAFALRHRCSPAALPSLAADQGFAERAAKFSCFGSRSFNGRTCSPSSATPSQSMVALPRVASSLSLKLNRSPPRNRKLPSSGANFNEESSVSEELQSGQTGSNSRKIRSGIPGKLSHSPKLGVEFLYSS